MSSGNFLDRQWLLALATILCGALLFAFGRGSLPGAGQSTTYVVTVVPLDEKSLACASDIVLGSRRCAFDAKQAATATNRPLRPFVTIGRELLLLSGVFESSSVAAWLEAARRSGDESRVTLSCYVKLLGPVPEVLVRWAPEGLFQPEQNVMAADVEDCVLKQ